MSIKARAHGAVRTALKQGRLIKPEACQRCGAPDIPCSDGRRRLQAHHHDHAKPLDVEWICPKCHRAETPLPAVMGGPPIGSRNAMAKLNTSSVLEARELRGRGWTFQAIATRFGVDKMTALRAVKGQLWAHVIAAAPSAALVAQPEQPLGDAASGPGSTLQPPSSASAAIPIAPCDGRSI